MSETNQTPGGDHIEELLSQLKGIFGHLSETEQEEAKQKITPPPVSNGRASQTGGGVTPPATGPLSTPPSSESQTPSPPPEEDLTAPTDFTSLPPAEFASPSPPGSSGEPTPPEAPDPFTPQEVILPEGASLLPAAIFYPAGRIHEAKIVADKVGRITPKFTKVAVVLNVQVLATYDTKSDLKNTFLTQIKNSPIKAVFLLIEKPMEETRRKVLVSELESRGIYFQEIPFHQIEKKALYTDMLLGMVFFFDSQKPAQGETPAD